MFERTNQCLFTTGLWKESNRLRDLSMQPQSHSKGKGTGWKLSRVVWVTPAPNWMLNNAYWQRVQEHQNLSVFSQKVSHGRQKKIMWADIDGRSQDDNLALGLIWKQRVGGMWAWAWKASQEMTSPSFLVLEINKWGLTHLASRWIKLNPDCKRWDQESQWRRMSAFSDSEIRVFHADKKTMEKRAPSHLSWIWGSM